MRKPPVPGENVLSAGPFVSRRGICDKRSGKAIRAKVLEMSTESVEANVPADVLCGEIDEQIELGIPGTIQSRNTVAGNALLLCVVQARKHFCPMGHDRYSRGVRLGVEPSNRVCYVVVLINLS